ncbi:N-acetylneuraminate 9-O-acetyltransferase-like [Liolophura sinensis]|uniref:N-acetylneuraminate 9-O-acetyltransferase-like n=1 Tax=Liolophura sinensis TaxID=3198878 RepID=UPI003159523F
MKAVTSTTDILWMLQDPTDKRKMDDANIDIKGPRRIDAYNKMAVKLLSPTPVKIWQSARKVALRFPNDSDAGGLHYGPRVIHYKVQLFLNWYCNRHMNFADGTCCTSPDVVQSVYVTTAKRLPPPAIVTVLLSGIILVLVIRVTCSRSTQHTPEVGKLDGFTVGQEKAELCV